MSKAEVHLILKQRFYLIKIKCKSNKKNVQGGIYWSTCVLRVVADSGSRKRKNYEIEDSKKRWNNESDECITLE